MGNTNTGNWDKRPCFDSVLMRFVMRWVDLDSYSLLAEEVKYHRCCSDYDAAEEEQRRLDREEQELKQKIAAKLAAEEEQRRLDREEQEQWTTRRAAKRRRLPEHCGEIQTHEGFGYTLDERYQFHGSGKEFGVAIGFGCYRMMPKRAGYDW